MPIRRPESHPPPRGLQKLASVEGCGFHIQSLSTAKLVEEIFPLLCIYHDLSTLLPDSSWSSTARYVVFQRPSLPAVMPVCLSFPPSSLVLHEAGGDSSAIGKAHQLTGNSRSSRIWSNEICQMVKIETLVSSSSEARRCSCFSSIAPTCMVFDHS